MPIWRVRRTLNELRATAARPDYRRGVDLTARWPLPEQPGLRDELLAAYAGTERGYHDQRHLAEVLDHLELLAGEASDPELVVLAAWFHDAVYEGSGSDEERSADLARARLGAAGLTSDAVTEVSRLVLLTATHRPDGWDHNGQVLCDADLAILAADAERYAEYVAGVRREHVHVRDDEFRRGRAAVLRALLAKPSLFHTHLGRRTWESAARANVEQELGELDA